MLYNNYAVSRLPLIDLFRDVYLNLEGWTRVPMPGYSRSQRNKKLIKSDKNILIKFQTVRALPQTFGTL